MLNWFSLSLAMILAVRIISQITCMITSSSSITKTYGVPPLCLRTEVCQFKDYILNNGEIETLVGETVKVNKTV